MSPEKPSARDNRRLIRVVVSTTMLAAVITTVRIVAKSKKGSTPSQASASATPEVYGEIPDFAFQTEAKAAYSKADLLGHVTIANFIFTRCKTVCPVFTMKMKRIYEQTGSDIQLLSFSVDPEYDTPERLTEYANAHDVDTSRWHFLTGDADAVKETVEGALKISMERQGEDEEGIPDIVHGGHFVLFDHMGRIRGYYNSDDLPRIQRMLKDARWLATQVPPK